jgi:hypothetical protein
MKPPLTVALLVAGLAAMFAGPWLVSMLLPPAALWTEADQQALTKARAEMHAATDGPGVSKNHADYKHEPGAAPDFAQAKAAYERQQARHDAAQSRSTWLMYAVRGLGILLAAAGVAGFLLQRQRG